jgi:pimeloyl-ACP methyl ester carboxylesterase
VKTHSKGAALLLASALALAACGSGSSSSSYTAVREGSNGGSTSGTSPSTDDGASPGTTEATSSGTDSIEWNDCGSAECGTLDVPYDYDDPSVGSFTLALAKHEATGDRIGSLLVNPGGPGFGGTVLALQAEGIYSSSILEHFDIIGWDPRGTGESTPAVDCVDEYDSYFGLDVPPSDDAEHQALVDAGRDFGAECEKNSGEILPYISTEASARDIDSIRQALGEDQISYFGFSYGSELGSVWVKLFPDTVRAAVIDGASDPAADYVQGGLNQAKGFERQLDAFLANCSADTTCDFHNGGDSEGAFDALMEQLGTSPLEVSADRTPVTRGVAYTAVSNAMYLQQLWPGLATALADAQKGDGSGLLAGYDDYYQRQSDGTYGNELEAFLAISCLDDPGPRTVEGVDANIPEFLAAAPRLGASFAYGYVCALWPVDPVGKVDVTGAGDGPVVVIGTTGDPATPIEGTENMAKTLGDGRLIVVTADQHTGYGVNQCVDDAVDDYLVDLKAPDDGLQCK